MRAKMTHTREANRIIYLILPYFDTYPLPRPGTYPRGAGTPIKDFFFLFSKDIFSKKAEFPSHLYPQRFQYGGQ